MTTSLRQSEQYACYMRKKNWCVVRLPLSANRNQSNEKPTAGEAPGARSTEAPGAGECSGHIDHINTFIKKIPLLGSVIKIQRPPAIPSEKILDKLAKKHRALFIKIEPSFKISRFQRDTWPLLPTKTLHLDLTKPERELWNNLDKDAQYSIRKAEKKLKVKRYTLKRTEELRGFHKILKNAGKRQGFPTPNWQDLKNLADCFEEKGWLITTGAACLLLLTHNQTAYYHHAATTKKGRNLLAGYLVLWEAIKLAKEQNCKTFDFCGIYDERYHKRTKVWKGFTYFKKKFGGKEVTYPQPIIKYYSTPFKIMTKIFGN